MFQSICRAVLGIAAGLWLAGVGAGASIPDGNLFEGRTSGGFGPSLTLTADGQELVEVYLAPAGGRIHRGWAARPLDLATGDSAWLAAGAPRTVVFEAPAELPAPTGLVSLVYPEVTGLANSSSDERANPLSDATVLALGPGGVGRYMNGKPDGSIANWILANESAISYIRPHVNVQMMLALEASAGAAAFEGPGLEPHAYLAVDHRMRVDSADIGSGTDAFGRRPVETPAQESQTAMAVGLDLGILPTFLAQMGMNISVVASQGQETGNVKVALVGTAELPIDWLPRERPINHPTGLAIYPYILASNPHQFGHGGIGAGGRLGNGNGGNGGNGGGGGGGGGGPIPIVPVVPEPASLLLIGLGAIATWAGRRRRQG
jgi:hypothetical protein